MDETEQDVIKEMLPSIVEDFDPLYVLPCLYSFLPLQVCSKLRTFRYRHDRVYYFIEKALNSLTLEDVFKIFSYQGAYIFLIEEIQRKIKRCQNEEVYYAIKIKLFTKDRRALVEFRHHLKTYSLTGNQISFDKEVNDVVQKWTDISYRGTLTRKEQVKLADRYFFVRDAQCENMRLKYDSNLLCTNVLFEIEKVTPFTSNPVLVLMMYLARKGSAIIMSNPALREEAYKDYIETAEHYVDHLPACRETGLVFYIKYNFLCLEYEQTHESKLKFILFATAEKAIDHFCREYQTVASDFHNIFFIKLAHLHLGIGVLGNNIDGVSITRKDIESAEELLFRLNVGELSDRWKWGLYIAKSKIFLINKDFQNALKYAYQAFKHALKGNFKREIMVTEETIHTLSYRKYWKMNNLEEVNGNLEIDRWHLDLVYEINYIMVCLVLFMLMMGFFIYFMRVFVSC
ncbi:uncharacterized protein LOC127733472 [Mytilus californianus]|uniref:uncharacterized protein LOC127733472 n=1 Tax=Mytilus californianus TaxID=6549 RepID=UPI002246AF50|nr:uncharacterized protein LOC127733472 [Mytilus californianus]